MKKIALFLSLSFIVVFYVVLSGAGRSEAKTGDAKHLWWSGRTAVISIMAALSDSCYTFTVDNASSDSLGDVTINGASGYADFNVTATGEYQQSLCFTAVSATIAGTVVPYPNSANIKLPSGASITAGWQSPSLIEVANGTTQNMPTE